MDSTPDLSGYYIYSIDDDVVTYAIDSNDTQYRFNQSTGKWQVKYGNLAGWGDVNGYFYLTDILNSYGVLTANDLSGISTELGLPQQVDVYLSGRPGLNRYQATSLAQLLSIFGTYINQNQITNGDYLSSDGSKVTNTVSMSSAFLLQNGLVGLARLLGNQDSSYKSLNASGYAYNSEDKDYLRSLVRGQIGIASLLGGADAGITGNNKPYLQTIDDNIYNILLDIMGNTKLSPDDYVVGLPGAIPGLERSNIALYLGDYLSAINRGVVSFGYDWLGVDGTIQPNKDQLNLSMADVTTQGFLGLASILRGSNDPSGVIPWTYTMVDYTDMSTKESQVNSIIEAILLPIQDIQNDLAYYLYSHGTNLDIEMRENMQDQADAFVEDFTASGGQGTPSAGNINDTAGVSGGIKDTFASTATPADVFTSISDDGNYSFLSSETQKQLNPFYNNTRSYSVSSDDFVDYVNPKIEEIKGGLGSSW